MDFFTTDTLLWIGIIFCISQSAMFSGLNLAFFSLSRLQLEVEMKHGNSAAGKVLEARKDSNYLLTTILWGNVSINVLLTLLSDSALAGIAAFAFSTIFITIFGEILPQAYFSRNALRMASLLTPVLKFYQFVLMPVARPCALFLDKWLGKEGIDYLREKELISMIHAHMDAEDSEIDEMEGRGALNFLMIDKIKVTEEGEIVDAKSIIRLPTKVDFPLIPDVSRDVDDPFLQLINASGHHWVVLANEEGHPMLLLDADAALRAALMDKDKPYDIYHYCRRPLVIRDTDKTISEVIRHLKSLPSSSAEEDAAIDYDAVLVWGDQPRIITGADILGKLLKGIQSTELA
ncbi:MAG: metal transporter CNNM [Oleispira sp.]|jgi:metal transporter CNNM